jgi:hypothetical protein
MQYIQMELARLIINFGIENHEKFLNSTISLSNQVIWNLVPIGQLKLTSYHAHCILDTIQIKALYCCNLNPKH